MEVLKRELISLLKAPEYLAHDGLTLHLCHIEAYFVLPELIRERIKKEKCIDKID